MQIKLYMHDFNSESNDKSEAPLLQYLRNAASIKQNVLRPNLSLETYSSLQSKRSTESNILVTKIATP